MKKAILVLSLICSISLLNAQQSRIDSVKTALAQAKDDTTAFGCYLELFYYYVYVYPDSAVLDAQNLLLLARKVNSDLALISALETYSELYHITGNFPLAIQYGYKGLEIAEKAKDFLLLVQAYDNMSVLFADQGDYKKAVQMGERGKSVYDAHYGSYPSSKSDTTRAHYVILVGLAQAYEKNGQLDSSLKYIGLAQKIFTGLSGYPGPSPICFTYGNIFSKTGDYAQAIKYYHLGIKYAEMDGIKKDIIDNSYGLANIYWKLHEIDSTKYYASRVLETTQTAHYPLMEMGVLTLLADAYKAQKNSDSAAKYLELTLTVKDSLFNTDKLIQIQNLIFGENQRQQEIEKEQRRRIVNLRLYILIAGVGVLTIVALLLYRNNLQKQRANRTIERAYGELKSTQAQLIQSEKMASLGELTAGIAHEIQNPLNFVNNFSEVNRELVTELKAEIKKGNLEEINAIADDIETNEEKINHHGKRADAIVKGMLQHSRSSSGQKELTDINALVDEYLRLAYHGLRARDKTFNAETKTDFDPNVGKINIVSQDIGRVILNLINNAFYAVNERVKLQAVGYKPQVIVHTRKSGNNVEIRVEDNGNGIPKNIVDKIFQPFFTTKPTGQGTGLGLSLSYDIVKAHGGEIKVETAEGEGSEFIVQLPTTFSIP